MTYISVRTGGATGAVAPAKISGDPSINTSWSAPLQLL